MLVTSRSFLEYQAFFALTDEDLAGRLLDCCAGASGFAAEANARGGRVIAVDPAYAKGTPELLADTDSSTTRGAAILTDHEARFVWTWYGSRGRRDRLRREALALFTADLQAHPETYAVGALPQLPFRDDAFDLALCSHLLFTWSDVLDEQWHDRAVHELLRVAPAVRIFPLVVQGIGDPVSFLPGLVHRLRAEGHLAEIVPVPYEFQRGATTMLTIQRRLLPVRRSGSVYCASCGCPDPSNPGERACPVEDQRPPPVERRGRG